MQLLHVLRFSFHSPHKLLDAAHIYLGLTFKRCYMLELFYYRPTIDFILGKSWWFEKSNMSYDQPARPNPNPNLTLT